MRFAPSVAALVVALVSAPARGDGPPAPGEKSLGGDSSPVVAPAPAPTVANNEDAAPLDADECVAVALAKSGQIAEARARFDEYRARLAEVESIYYPKLDMLGWVAPMFEVRGSALERDVKRDYGSWGPYLHLEGILAWPIYSFGRVEAGEKAASERAEVERARIREAANMVALEVRKLYYTRLYALSMVKPLAQADEQLATAIAQAEKLHEAGTGDVTQVDLMKLTYGHAEVRRLRLVAEEGASLALAALKHTMGLPAEAPLTLSDSRLASILDGPPPELGELMVEASRRRPEWAQIQHGERAALSLAAAEALANAPVVAIAGSLNLDWTNMRDDTPNPYHNDPYNRVEAGIAVAIQWGFDPAKADAREDAARAVGAQVAALKAFASTGIPLQVRAAYRDLLRARKTDAIARDGEAATRRWMTFAAAAFETGTGEAKDLVEGLVANLQAKRTRYENLRDYYLARAALDHAVGRPAGPDGRVMRP